MKRKSDSGNDAGRILIFTGGGKGKTTAALGMVLRAHGHGIRAAVIQFIKSDRETGEFAALRNMAGVEIVVTGLGFVPRPDDPSFADHRHAAEAGLRIVAEAILSGRFGLIVLDEICNAVSLELLTEESVLTVLGGTRSGCAIVLTGRNATEGLIRIADTVSEMRCIKHGYDHGRKAEKGVEY